MDKRRKPIDPELLRQQRVQFFEAVSRGELTLQQAVKQMRALSRLTQEEFAKHRGVSIKIIKELERGTGNPTLKSLNQIGAIFGLEIGYVRKTNLQAHASVSLKAPP